MAQFSYMPNGDLVISAETTDELLKQMFLQLPQGLTYVPRSFVPKSVYNYYSRLVMTANQNTPTLVNPNGDVYEISPITHKIIARNTESFFAMLVEQFKQGYTYSEGSGNMRYGSNSAVLQKIESTGDEAVADADLQQNEQIQEFNLDVALAIQEKDSLLVYLDKYGIKADARKSLASLQNWLKAQQLAGN